uniref:Putative oxidoreductase, short chain dehydrogenase/reductase family protein n=1 Tax=Magnetococcus massalia (strain MO-1) TaxID=451514 RepID=A0A1S7LJR5_MAGMO|nr:Putative oxidoreductase, short chain dehydrogenase/reductase family protein [Candidatus Magnetococcus massalia]
MAKTVLITGSTDGIGLETAKMLYAKGHRVLLHGRSQEKLAKAQREIAQQPGEGQLESYLADLSRMVDVAAMAEQLTQAHSKLDLLINNAGVYNTPKAITPEGLDLRFVVNTIAPYLLTQRLLPLMDAGGRVVNLSSAAQASVELDALAGRAELADGPAYAQSKLAITMWSHKLAMDLKARGPAIIAVNPASMLGSKMVQQAFGVAGGDIRIGADILVRAALSDEFANASGRYYDNDVGKFAAPHPDALDGAKCRAVIDMIEKLLARLTV